MQAKTTRAKTRLNSVIMRDKITAIEGMLRTLKAEQYKLLTNYMYLNPQNLTVYIDVTENGEYVLVVRAVTDKLIDFGKPLS
ncbi:MAG: hypothetical protein IKC64_00185 [Clostridia bacterium]|nr:hypothetical protein [Clostridia bacterium]